MLDNLLNYAKYYQRHHRDLPLLRMPAVDISIGSCLPARLPKWLDSHPPLSILVQSSFIGFYIISLAELAKIATQWTKTALISSGNGCKMSRKNARLASSMDQVLPLLLLHLSSLPAMSSLLTGQTDNMLFSPRRPFARLSEAPGAQIFGRSFRTPQQSPESSHLKAPLDRQEAHGYERRPRRKTKDDRYEYKGHDRRADPERSKKEKKTAKQSRKHTLDRDFYAPNVSQTRLTVCVDYQPFEIVANSVIAHFSSEHGDIWQRTNVFSYQIS